MANQSSTVYLSLQTLQDQDLVEFFDDTLSYLKGTRTPFLTKYGGTLGVGNVVPLRDFLV
jgi:hypothetical protein